jgi:hypothetical protein
MLLAKLSWLAWEGLHFTLSMQRWKSSIWLSLSHDYKVFNIIHKVLITTIMKLHYYWMTATSRNHSCPRVSRWFESILNHARVTTWQHDTQESWRQHEWQLFKTTIKELSRAHLTLMHVFHVIPRWAFVGSPRTIPYTSCGYGRVSSNLVSIDATKFAGPHKSHMHHYIIEYAHRGQAINP